MMCGLNLMTEGRKIDAYEDQVDLGCEVRLRGNLVASLRVALPFQTVETVNESSQDRQLNLLRPTSKLRIH